VGEHRILEHTADVGVAATASSLEELFEEMTLGLLDITGARGDSAGTEEVAIALTDGRDSAGLLVEWLSEVLYLQDARDQLIGSIGVSKVTNTEVIGRVSVAPRTGPVEGTPVKAVTYHQLVVEARDGVFTAQVFFDI
jgi:SHS2 domain-containing protein